MRRRGPHAAPSMSSAAALVFPCVFATALVFSGAAVAPQGAAARTDTPASRGPGGADPAPSVPPPSAAASGTTSASSVDERGHRLLLDGKAAEAARLYAEAISADPSDRIAMAGRIRALIVQDLWKEALSEARRFAASLPGYPESAAPVPPPPEAVSQAQDGPSAQTAPASPLRRSGNADVLTALGEALYRAGLIPEAARTLEPIAAVASPPARALLFLGLSRAAEGRDAEAAELLARASSSDPDDRDILFRAAGAAPTRARAVQMLEAYLARCAGDDPDRIEGARGTIRLYRALGERPVWVPDARPPRVEIPMWPLRDRSGGLRGFVIEMTVPQGRPIRLLLDTGSSGLFLVERIAARAGFSVLSEETVFAGGGDAHQATRRGLFSAVGFGPVSFKDALASVTNEEIEATGLYHGVVGPSVFAGYSVTLDLPRARLVLEKETGQAQGSPYWDVEGQMLVEAGTGGGARGLFLLDTGATSSVLSESFALLDPAARLGDPASVRAFGGPLRGSRSLRGVTLRFQGLETQAGSALRATDLTQRSRLGGVEVAGFLGLDLLERATITVAPRARRVAVLAGRK